MLKTLKIICFATVIAAGVYMLQALVGQPLLSTANSDISTVTSNVGGISRFYNLPSYTLFALIFYTNQFFKKKNLLIFIGMAILLGAILISFNRNTLFVSLFCIIAVMYNNKKFSFLNLALLITCVSTIGFFGSLLQSDRLSEGSSDLKALTNLSAYKNPSSYSPNKVSTTEFRILHFYERLLYIRSRSAFIFTTGIGLVNDQSSIKNSLHFQIGLPVSPGSKQLIQIDTGDIVWSLFILQTGILGVALFCCVMMSYFLFFLKNRVIALSFIAAIYIFTLVVISFFGTDIISPQSALLYSMLFIYIKKLVNNDNLVYIK